MDQEKRIKRNKKNEEKGIKREKEQREMCERKEEREICEKIKIKRNKCHAEVDQEKRRGDQRKKTSQIKRRYHEDSLKTREQYYTRKQSKNTPLKTPHNHKKKNLMEHVITFNVQVDTGNQKTPSKTQHNQHHKQNKPSWNTSSNSVLKWTKGNGMGMSVKKSVTKYHKKKKPSWNTSSNSMLKWIKGNGMGMSVKKSVTKYHPRPLSLSDMNPNPSDNPT